MLGFNSFGETDVEYNEENEKKLIKIYNSKKKKKYILNKRIAFKR